LVFWRKKVSAKVKKKSFESEILSDCFDKMLHDSWNWKKLKDEYPKLTYFKVWVYFFKSDEKSRVISEVFQKKKNILKRGQAIHIFGPLLAQHLLVFVVLSKIHAYFSIQFGPYIAHYLFGLWSII
jgi:hypothetical protein